MTPDPAIVDDIDLLGEHRERALPIGPGFRRSAIEPRPASRPIGFNP